MKTKKQLVALPSMVDHYSVPKVLLKITDILSKIVNVGKYGQIDILFRIRYIMRNIE